MEKITCNKCGCENIWVKSEDEWPEQNCPMCGDDLIKQQEGK